MGLRSYLVDATPFAAMVIVEFRDVGLSTLSKAAMSRGMSPFVFVVYSNALATLILLPSSFLINRSHLLLYLLTLSPHQQLHQFPFLMLAEQQDHPFLSRFSANSSS